MPDFTQVQKKLVRNEKERTFTNKYGMTPAEWIRRQINLDPKKAKRQCRDLMNVALREEADRIAEIGEGFSHGNLVGG